MVAIILSRYQLGPVGFYCVCISGETWQEKVAEMREELTGLAADVLMITALDETACKE